MGMVTTMLKTYTELSRIASFEDRFLYLQLKGEVGESTFGFDRFLNQQFYRSADWKRIRNHVIARDLGRDLGVEGFDISEKIIIHHMNPIGQKDVLDRTEFLLDPEFLICVSHDTHNALHFGDIRLLDKNKVIERKPGDTCPWKR